MIELFKMGGPLFMGILTILLFSLLLLTFRGMISSGVQSESHDKSGLKQIQIIGRLALALGLLAMMIGLYSAFSAIEGQEVSQSILAGGLKVASIAPMYGLIIYSIAQLASFFIIRRK